MNHIKEKLSPKGRVEIFTTKGAPKLVLGNMVCAPNGLPPHYDSVEIDFSDVKVIDTQDIMNIVVNSGKDTLIRALANGSFDIITRMAIGDRGALPSDGSIPKTPVGTATKLFNEVRREDIDAVVLNIGTANAHEVKFIKTFSSATIPLTAYSNQAAPVVNEIGLITANPAETPFPRVPVTAPSAHPADEVLFSIRTFKSVPFEAANEIAITIRYTIFID